MQSSTRILSRKVKPFCQVDKSIGILAARMRIKIVNDIQNSSVEGSTQPLFNIMSQWSYNDKK